MSEFVRLGDHITIAKGRPPAELSFDGPGANLYLTPEYLRGRASALLARPGQGAVDVADGDAVLLWDGSNAGEFFRGRAGLAASTMARLRADDSIERGYLVHALKHLEPGLKSQTSGTGIPHVDREVLEGFRVFRPPSLEQSRIAKILDTLDTTIRQTEAIIEKLKQVKQGLLHDLLTRGIDANGELRPPRSEAPSVYKDSPLGWVPKEWTVVKFGEVGEVQLGRQSAPRYQRGVDTKPYLRVVNILGDRLDLRDVKCMDFGASDFQRFRLMPGDVLLTEGDLASAYTVGRSAVYNGEIEDCCFQNTLIRFRPTQPECADYFHFSFCYLRATGRFAAATTATTVHHLSAGRLGRELFLPLPPLPERDAIAKRLRGVERQIDFEELDLAKHRKLNSGLMDDLLTGRVRVTALLDQGAPA